MKISWLFALLCFSSIAAAPKKPGPLEHGGLTNAAQRKYGAAFSLEAGAGVKKNGGTPVDAVFDGSVHSRCVVTGVPYTFVIELFDKLPIEKIAFAHDDSEAEAAAKEIEIALEDGTVIQKTLEHKVSPKGKPAWQEVVVGKESRIIRVTIKSLYITNLNWGGMGEIAVLTKENLDERFKIPGWDDSAPVFVHSVSPAAQKREVKVTLPPVAKAGEHPRLLMTRGEAEELKKALASSERGKAALATLTGLADGMLGGDLEFPDPNGPPGQQKDRRDPIAARHSKLSNMAGTLGRAYTLTGEVRYAKRAAEILRGYAQRYPAYPEHKGANKADTGKVMAQRLSEAMWLMPQILAYDDIHGSGVLSDADKAAIEKDMIRAAVTFIRRKEPAREAAERDRANREWRTAAPADNKRAAANWLNFYNAATMLAGCAIDDKDMVDLSATDFRSLIHNGIGADGMWGEGAIGYQLFAVRAMTTGFEAAARRGIDLWGFENGKVKFMFDSPLWYAYPDATAPGINDSGRARFDNWESMIYDYAYLRYGDDRYAPIVNRSPRQLHFTEAVYVPTWVYGPLKEPQILAAPSMVFDKTGYAILRGGDRYTLLKYGPHGGVHGHFDKLNLILFGGDELGGEPKFHRYEDPLHRQWTVQTVAHNTMTVDGMCQVPAAGKLLVFEDAPGMQVMRAQVAGAAPGALLDRTVVVLDGAVIDLFSGRSGFSRTWDRTLRFNGTLRGFGKPSEHLVDGGREGYQHLKLVTCDHAPDPWHGTWDTSKGPLDVWVTGAKEIRTALGPDDDHIALPRSHGDEASFGTVYSLQAWRGEVRSVDWLDENAVTGAQVELSGGKARVWSSTRPGRWEATGMESDARVLVVFQKGEQIRILLTGGSYMKGAGAELKFDKAGNYVAEGTGSKLLVKSQWTPEK